MRIWKLTPTNLEDPIWAGKWRTEPIIVAAESEREARHLALIKTNRGFAPLPPMLMPVNPWMGYKLKGDAAPTTICEDITGLTDEFSVNGPAEVLRHGE